MANLHSIFFTGLGKSGATSKNNGVCGMKMWPHLAPYSKYCAKNGKKMRIEAGANVEQCTDSHVILSGADFGVGPILSDE